MHNFSRNFQDRSKKKNQSLPPITAFLRTFRNNDVDIYNASSQTRDHPVHPIKEHVVATALIHCSPACFSTFAKIIGGESFAAA